MKFFVPIFGDKAQLLWNVVRSGLFFRGRFTTDRRIRALFWRWETEEDEYVAVGADLPGGAADDPVLAILESSLFANMVFVFTMSQFRNREPPTALAVTTGWRLEAFDDDPPAPVRKRTAPRRHGAAG